MSPITAIAIVLGTVPLSLIFVSVLLALIAPLFFKEALQNDPNNPGKFALFVEVEPSRAKVIMQSGKVLYVLYGDPEPGREDLGPVQNGPRILDWYRRYVWRIAALHVIIPYFTEVYTYPLPHYETDERAGKVDFISVKTMDKKGRSDHVRNEPFNWPFILSGAEVETVPMTMKGVAQAYVRRDNVQNALFLTDRWNKLLDTALQTVSRRVLRSCVTLPQIIGEVSKDIWTDEKEDKEDGTVYGVVQDKIMEEIRRYEVAPEVRDQEGNLERKALMLSDIIVVTRTDILDFEPELEGEERKLLRAAALGRQNARKISLEGEGEAEAIKKRLEAAASNPDLGNTAIMARALIDASENGGELTALAQSVIQWIGKKNMSNRS